MELVGDGERLQPRVGEAVAVDGLQRRVFAGPQDQRALGVRRRRFGVGQSGGDELLGEAVVGGEEDVDGGAVLDLRARAWRRSRSL